MSVVTTKRFSFNDGEDWHYEVNAFSDCVEIIYYEENIEKERINLPTFVASRMLPVAAEMAIEAESDGGTS